MVEEFDVSEVEVGDFVDFGPYGKFYVVSKDTLSEDWWWITDQVADRFNPDASGWSIRNWSAQAIIEHGADVEVGRWVM